MSLIDAEYLRSVFSEIAEAVDENVERAIEEAEIMEIASALGDKLYYDLVANTGLQKYIDLLNGRNYTDENGVVKKFKGLKLALAYFAMAYLLDTPYGIHITEYGQRWKESDLSERPEDKALVRASTKKRDLGTYYLKEVKKYISLNKSLYVTDETCNTHEVNTNYSKLGGVSTGKYSEHTNKKTWWRKN
jgi:hypothetical protein